MEVNKEAIRTWCEALESGKYLQGKEALTTQINGRDFDCCLGVACKVLGQDLDINNFYERVSYNNHVSKLPREICNVLGFPYNPEGDQESADPNDPQSVLIRLNDIACSSFTEISSYLRSKYLGGQ